MLVSFFAAIEKKESRCTVSKMGNLCSSWAKAAQVQASRVKFYIKCSKMNTFCHVSGQFGKKIFSSYSLLTPYR